MSSRVSDAEKRLRGAGAVERRHPSRESHARDAKSDLLVVIASRLIMNDGGPITGAHCALDVSARRERLRRARRTRRPGVAFSPRQPSETNNAERPFADPPLPRTPTTAADVVNSVLEVMAANAWVRRAFGDGVEVNVDMVDAALRQAKEHFTRSKEGGRMRGCRL